MANIKGSVISINISEEKGVIKTPVSKAEFKIDHGIVGDAHAGSWNRQVSLLGIESFSKMEEKDLQLEAGSFAENITTQGIVLFTLPVGTKLKIGETIQEITQIGKKCHRGCQISQITGDCIMPREGIFTKVLQGGIVEVGDPISTII